MIKKLKNKFLTTTVLFSLLLTSCFYLVFTLPVYGLETNTKIEAMTVLNDVFGLTAEDYSINSFKEQSLDYWGLLKNETDFILASSQSKVRVTISYVDNVLHQVFFSGFEGKLAEEKPVNNTYEEAKNLLINYQNYVGGSLYGELASMLDNVDVNKNITKANGNKRLTISNFDQKVIDYVWRYIDENGCVAKRKSVTLSYDRGQLKLFLNNWPLYTIVGTPEITGEEATAIALEASKTYSFEITTDNGTSIISGFDISPNSIGHETMSYLNFPNETYARGGDPFTLYPSWYVPIGFTKFYPGNLAGMTVTVWADTGEVSTTNPMVVNLFPLNSTDEEVKHHS